MLFIRIISISFGQNSNSRFIGGRRLENRSWIHYELFYPAITEITDKGIVYKDNLYSCSAAIRQQWFIKARDRKINVTIYYDSIHDDYILVQLENGYLSIAYKIEEQRELNKKDLDSYFELINSIKKKFKQRKKPTK